MIDRELDRALGAAARSETMSFLPTRFAEILASAGSERLDSLVATVVGPDPERRRTAAARAFAVEIDFERASSALTSAGIRHLVLKGVFTDLALFGGQGLRPVTDLDFLIDPDDEATATAALASAGWRPVIYPNHAAWAAASKERLFRAAGRLPVDLHVRAIQSPPYRDFGPAIFARAQRVRGPSFDFLAPGWEDAVIVAAANLAGESYLSPRKQAIDLAAILARTPVDLALAAERAEELGATTSLWAALNYVSTRFGAIVPDGVMSRIRPAAPLERWVELATGVRRRRFERWRAGSGLRALARVVILEWPLSGRPLWPLEFTWRWAQLRRQSRSDSSAASPNVTGS